MGGIAAIAAVAVLGDGTLAAADGDPTAPRGVDVAPRPTVVGVVADSTAPELEIPVATRMRGPAGRFLAARLFDGAARVLGADPRATEPSRVIGLLETVPLLLIHGEADTTVPIADGRRLAALAGPCVRALGRSGTPDTAAVMRSRPMTTSGGSRTSFALRSAAGAATMSARRGPAL